MPTNTPARLVWVARLVSNTLGVTEGQGSIFRVHVQGIEGIPIELRSGDQLITANSGSKSEYGPFAAEFAPVTKGTWTVSVPALGIALDVVADSYNLAVIEFVQIPQPEATKSVQPTATATALGAKIWQGRLVSETPGSGVPFSRLLVQVVGLDNHPVRISTVAQTINTAATGQKPDELGPNTVEFTGLTPGQYIVEPLWLNVSYQVELKPNIETRIQFTSVTPTAPAPTTTPTAIFVPAATFTPAPPTATAIPTLTPSPTPSPTPSVTPLPTFTPPPQPTATPVTRWLGVVESRSNSHTQSIVVKITGIEGLQVRLTANTGQERRCITGQDGNGQDRCAFPNLEPGQYYIAPEGLGITLPVMLYENEAMQVNFGLEVLPPGVTGWQAGLNKNTNSAYAKTQFEGVVRVRVTGQPGQIVALHPARIPNAVRYCEVVYNPVLGGLICEFGQLGPGIYRVEAINTGADLRLFVDGAGEAEVEFFANNTFTTQTPSQVGQGARPNLPTPTVTPIPLVFVQPSPTSLPPPTPTPAFAWQGRILESDYTGAGAIGVRAAGLKDHPVVLRSGGWQSQPQLTGTKVELGEYATEFGGLAPGDYIIQLVDLAEIKVTLPPGEFMLVEFRYDFVNPP